MNTVRATVSEVSLVGNFLTFKAFKENERWWEHPDEPNQEIKIALDLTDLNQMKTANWLLKVHKVPAMKSTWERFKYLADNGAEITVYEQYVVTGEEELKGSRKRK